MKSKLIALDIDGTILDMPSGFYVPKEVRTAVAEARDAGARVCLCSSRPCYMMDDATKDLDEIDALVGCSGAAIEVLSPPAPPTRIYCDILQQGFVDACVEIARKWNLYTSFAGDEKIMARAAWPFDQDLEENQLFEFLEEAELIKAVQAKPFSCAFIFAEPGMPEDALYKEPALQEATFHRSGGNCFIITNKNVDKGTGVLRLAVHFGIPREAILAVGNDENDIPMLKAAGVGVAVANASPKTLAAADWIAPDVRHAGAAEAIRRFAL